MERKAYSVRKSNSKTHAKTHKTVEKALEIYFGLIFCFDLFFSSKMFFFSFISFERRGRRRSNSYFCYVFFSLHWMGGKAIEKWKIDNHNTDTDTGTALDCTIPWHALLFREFRVFNEPQKTMLTHIHTHYDHLRATTFVSPSQEKKTNVWDTHCTPSFMWKCVKYTNTYRCKNPINDR